MEWVMATALVIVSVVVVGGGFAYYPLVRWATVGRMGVANLKNKLAATEEDLADMTKKRDEHRAKADAEKKAAETARVKHGEDKAGLLKKLDEQDRAHKAALATVEQDAETRIRANREAAETAHKAELAEHAASHARDRADWGRRREVMAKLAKQVQADAAKMLELAEG